ncbi:Gfo/Idh/MocA family protein [Bradyrhizobium sp. AZCC 2230]|uniref:Gfo/Idh/MocA family protein n=1 Tax=Bradyrhizobium sp. AZCC 2230 TaxID=3117021 RepID=UPI002FF4098B
MYQRDYKTKVRIGVVGLGSHSYRNILPTLTFLPVELMAVADIAEDVAKVTARQYGVRAYTSATEMYAKEELDAVLLCVSPNMHPKLAIEAFEAGLHVWMEKPAGASVADVKKMIASRADRICVVGLKKAFMPATRKAVELLSEEIKGPIRSGLAVYPMSIPADGKKVLEEGRFTRWLADSCHPLSMLVTMGGEVEGVTVHRGPEDVGGVCLLHHVNGALSTFILADGIPKFQPFERYLFIANDRSIEIDNSRKVVFQRGIPFAYGTGTSFAPPGRESGAIVWECQDSMNTLENKAVFSQGLSFSIQHFLDSVINMQVAAIGTLEFALHLTQIYEAALLSSGDKVTLESL